MLFSEFLMASDQFFYVWRFAFLINGGNDGLHVGVEIERALELTSRIIS